MRASIPFTITDKSEVMMALEEVPLLTRLAIVEVASANMSTREVLNWITMEQSK